MATRLSLAGETYGRLQVLEAAPPAKGGRTRWLCVCVCTKRVVVQTDNLRTGGTTSCGCARRDVLVHRNITQSPSRRYKDPMTTGCNTVIREYRANAKRRGRVWSLSITVGKTLFASNCVYCGVPPSGKKLQYGGSGKPLPVFTYNGIDRIDNSKGYTVQNTVACCGVCNHAKSAMTHTDFIAWLNRIAAYRLQRDVIAR